MASCLPILTADFVDVLQGETEGLVGGAGWGQDGIEGLQQSNSTGITVLALNLPPLEPGHLYSDRTN